MTFENIAEAEATRLEDINVLEEERLNTIIQSARYQQTLRRYHVKAIHFRILVEDEMDRGWIRKMHDANKKS